MQNICKYICKMHGAECKFEYTHEFAPTVNWKNCVAVAAEAARNVVGEGKVNVNYKPIMASEDFGTFLQKIPGCLVFIGNGDCNDKVGDTPLHNSLYDYNDDILLTGSEFFAELIRIRLPK